MDSNFRKTFTNLQQIDDQESGHISDDSDECEDKENNINSQNTVDLTLESKNEEVSTCNKTRYDLRKRNASNQQVPKKAKKRPRTKVPLAKYQNPDRLFYHVKTNLPIKNDEPEAEECYEWLRQLSLRQIDDFVDLNEGEKAFMKLWNAHLHLNPCYGDRMLVRILEEFIDEYGIRIYRRNLQRNLTLHLSNMHSFAAISPTTMIELITRFQKLVKDSLDFPEKYPVTPEKVPIESKGKRTRGRGRPKGTRNKAKAETEVVELSSNEDDDGDENQDESSDEESDDEVGDPSKDPGEGCSKEVPHDYLQPFVHGWRREVVYRYFNIFDYFFLG